MASTETDFQSLLPELTLEEKIALLSGQDFSTAAGNARLNITPIRVADTVCGIRGSGLESELGTATFPNTVCYGSTWDADLLEELGKHLAQQARSKSAQVILGPTINIHRDPRGGRNFECFSEDPLLSGQLAGAIVNGIRSLGVGVCPKHFVCNDSETLRHYYDVKEPLNGRTLREIYLAAWQHLLRVSNPEALMTAYNKVDGTYCSAHKDLIEGVLRGDWGYEGVAMSDWFGTKDTVGPIKAGLDLEMPFPVFRGGRLVEQVKSGAVTEAEIDVLASRMLQLRNRTRACHGINPERSEVNEETNKMAWELATGGMVLLKNENNVLPFDAAKTPKIALVGEYAADPVITGGGSASSIPQYKHSPLQILQKELPESTKYASGVRTRRIIPEAKPEKLANGEPGVTVKYFNKDAEEPILEENQPKPHVWMLGKFKDNLDAVGSRLEMSTKLKPDSTGKHTLAVRCTGSFALSVNGAKVLDGKEIKISTEQFIFNHTLLESRVEYAMNAGESYDIHLVMDGPQKLTMGEPTPYAATLCFEEYYSEEDAIKEAVEIAQSSDISIIYAGRNDQYESEGFDLEDIRMPENQTQLIKRVAAASKQTVLVLHCGNPIDVSAVVDDVDAILLAHFPGQEGAQATIDLLRGKACPSGRLSTTWFKTLEDSPSYGNFPCKKTDDGAVELSYAEGLHVGYRASDKEDRVRWPFGYGLSYTSFDYKDLKAVVSDSAEPKKLQCSVAVQNTGSVAGKEVVQLYIRPSTATAAWRPQKELKAFKKVQLQPSETATVELEVDVEVGCSYWDEAVNAWRLDAGTYTVAVGSLTQDFAVESGHTWNHL